MHLYVFIDVCMYVCIIFVLNPMQPRSIRVRIFSDQERKEEDYGIRNKTLVYTIGGNPTSW